MKTIILCIGGCLDGQRIHFRGNIFETIVPEETKIHDYKFEKYDHEKSACTHKYKIEKLFDGRTKKRYQIYIYEEIKEPFKLLIEGYTSNKAN